MRLSCALAAALVAITGTARADEPADDGTGKDPWDHAPIKNRVNFRVGFASSDLNGKPTLCLDITVAFGFGVETCGTGAQVLHNDPGQEMSHYRINYTMLEKNLWKGTLHARGGLGFSEMQVGYDDPGFVFGGTNRDRGSTAGPEAALSARWLLPMYKGFDFVVTGTAGLAYFAHASDLSVTKSDVQGFASIEAGIGW